MDRLSRLDQLISLADEPSSSIKKESKYTSRKEIEKKLNSVRKKYMGVASDHNSVSTTLDSVQKKKDKLEEELSTLKKDLIDISNTLKKMDLTRSDKIRERKNDVTFVVDGKEYILEGDDNDVNLTPWAEYRKRLNKGETDDEEESEEEDDSSDVNDASDGFDADMAALTDALTSRRYFG